MFIAFLITFIAGLSIGIVATCIMVAIRLERNPKRYIVNFRWRAYPSPIDTKDIDSVYISNTPTPDPLTLEKYVRSMYLTQTNGKTITTYLQSAYPL